MWGKSPRAAFYLTTRCGILPQQVVLKENRAWGENQQEINTKWDGFGLKLRSLDMRKISELECGVKDCCNLE